MFFMLVICKKKQHRGNHPVQYSTVQYAIDMQNLNPIFKAFQEPKNRFQGTNSARLCSLAGHYDNPISSRSLATIDCLKISAQYDNPTPTRFLAPIDCL